MGFPVSRIHTLLGLVGSAVPMPPDRLTGLAGCEGTRNTLLACIQSMTEPVNIAKRRLSWEAYNQLPPYSD